MKSVEITSSKGIMQRVNCHSFSCVCNNEHKDSMLLLQLGFASTSCTDDPTCSGQEKGLPYIVGFYSEADDIPLSFSSVAHEKI